MHINFSTRRNTGDIEKSTPWTTSGSLRDKEVSTPDKLLGRVQDEKIQEESLSNFPINYATQENNPPLSASHLL